LDPLIRSVSRVTTVLANVCSVFQLFSFFVVCSDMISKRFGLVGFLPAELMISSLWRHEFQNCDINKSCVCVSLRKKSNRNSQERRNITFCVQFATSDSEAGAMLSEACGTEDVRNWVFCGGVHSSESIKRVDDVRLSEKAQKQYVQTHAKYVRRRCDIFHFLHPPYLITR
jgi:hypothetical protein